MVRNRNHVRQEIIAHESLQNLIKPGFPHRISVSFYIVSRGMFYVTQRGNPAKPVQSSRVVVAQNSRSQLCVWKSPPQSKKKVLLVCPNFEKDGTTTSGKLIIHDMFILNLFFLKTVNNFNASRPFRLQNIFNHSIYNSTESGMDSSLINHLKIIAYSMIVGYVS